MPRFEPFPGIRYDAAVVDLADVIAPPYDVVDGDERLALESRSPYNAVHVELARDEPGRDRYAAAACAFEDWLAKGVLVQDEEPAFYVYRMGYRDGSGRARQTAGVIGALALSTPGEGDVLPHERTMPKPRDDRLNVLRSCQANLSPVWVLSPAEGLSALCEQPGPPDARATDDHGIHHRLWRVTAPGVVEAMAAAVGSAPAIIADGHHRFETALAYREERRAASGGQPGDYDLLMTYAVELTGEQLSVRPIHRLVSGLPADLDLPAALEPWFEAVPSVAGIDRLPAEMAEAGALGLVARAGTWLLRPRDTAGGTAAGPAAGNGAGEATQATDATDAALLAPALTALPSPDLAYHHEPAAVAAVVAGGEADAGFLLRPPTVGQIASAALSGRRMPEKTTFFHPKPRTGLVFRRVSG